MQPAKSKVPSIINPLFRAGLIILALLSVLTGFIFTLVLLFAMKARATPVDASEVVALVSCALGGCVIAVILMGLAAVLHGQARNARQQHEQIAALHTLNSALQRLEVSMALQTPPSNMQPATPAIVLQPVAAEETSLPTGSTEQLIAMLGQIRDLTMMTETERQHLAQRHHEEKRQQFQKQIESHIHVGNWAEAQKQIEMLGNTLPADPLNQTMAEKLRTERAARARQDVDASRTHIQHLMSITAWPQADDALRILQQKYPGEPQVDALTAEMQRERDAFEKENYSRLLLELRDATERREWRRAYVAGQELVRRYPNDRKVEKLRKEQLDTIKENAEALERKEEESLFKDLLQRQRYEDAAAVARRVIDKFPASSATIELSKLLPKVDELIRQEKLKRATVVGEK